MSKLPFLIPVTGLPASGKSGFSAYAGEKLAMPVLEKDRYKEILFDDIGFSSREAKLQLGTAAMNLMYDEAARLLRCGISVILDNNFETASLPGLKQLQEQAPCRLITVRIDADPVVVYERFVQRDLNPHRHRGHVVNSCYPEKGEPEIYKPIGCDIFCRRYKERGMMDFDPGGVLLVADATDFRRFSYEELLGRLKRAMENYNE